MIGLAAALVILSPQLQGLATSRQAIRTVTIEPPGPQRIGGVVEIAIDEPRCGPRESSVYRIEIAGSNPTEQLVTTDARGHAEWSYKGTNAGVDQIRVTRQGRLPRGCRPAPANYETSYEWTGEAPVVMGLDRWELAVGDVVAQLVPDGQGACRGTAGVDVLAGIDLDAAVTLRVDEACRVIVSDIATYQLDAAEDDQPHPVGENVAPSPGVDP